MPHGHSCQGEISQLVTAGSAMQMKSFTHKALHEPPCSAAISALVEGDEVFGQGHPDLACTQSILHLAMGSKGWKWVPELPQDQQLSMGCGCQKPGCPGHVLAMLDLHNPALMGQNKMLHPGEGSRIPARSVPMATVINCGFRESIPDFFLSCKHGLLLPIAIVFTQKLWQSLCGHHLSVRL